MEATTLLWRVPHRRWNQRQPQPQRRRRPLQRALVAARRMAAQWAVELQLAQQQLVVVVWPLPLWMPQLLRRGPGLEQQRVEQTPPQPERWVACGLRRSGDKQTSMTRRHENHHTTQTRRDPCLRVVTVATKYWTCGVCVCATHCR